MSHPREPDRLAQTAARGTNAQATLFRRARDPGEGRRDHRADAGTSHTARDSGGDLRLSAMSHRAGNRSRRRGRSDGAKARTPAAARRDRGRRRVPTLRVIFPFDRINYRTDRGPTASPTCGFVTTGRSVTEQAAGGCRSALAPGPRRRRTSSCDCRRERRSTSRSAGQCGPPTERSRTCRWTSSRDVTLRGNAWQRGRRDRVGRNRSDGTRGKPRLDTGSGSVELTRVRAPMHPYR